MNWAFLVAGRAALASSVLQSDLALAIGRGDGAWDAGNVPATTDLMAGLQDPFAMLRPTAKVHVSPVTETSGIDPLVLETMGVEPNPDGYFKDDSGGVWKVEASPTQFLYCLFVLGFDIASNETMREYIVYMDPLYGAGVLPGQAYIAWADVVAPGTPMIGSNDAPVVRNGPRDVIGVVMRF